MVNVITRIRQKLMDESAMPQENIDWDALGKELILIETIKERSEHALLIPVLLKEISSHILESLDYDGVVTSYTFQNLAGYSSRSLNDTDIVKTSIDYKKIWWLFAKGHFIENFFEEDDKLR